jgi:hypothetical protein
MPATNRAFIAQRHFISGAIELMQDDPEGLDRTIIPNGPGGGESSDEEGASLP